jgi:uncharacterized RDD family membrane protein YckC
VNLPPDDRASAPPPPPPLPPPPTGPAPGFATPAANWQASTAGLTALGSPVARLGAAVVDALVLIIPVYLLALIVGDSGGAVVGLLYLLGIALYAPLMMMREGANNGQTLGKQALGLRVVHETGQPMTFGNGLVRDAVGKSLLSLVTCGFYGLLDSLWCLWDPRKQCLHDKVGSTLVLHADADPRLATTLRI